MVLSMVPSSCVSTPRCMRSRVNVPPVMAALSGAAVFEAHAEQGERQRGVGAAGADRRVAGRVVDDDDAGRAGRLHVGHLDDERRRCRDRRRRFGQ